MAYFCCCFPRGKVLGTSSQTKYLAHKREIKIVI